MKRPAFRGRSSERPFVFANFAMTADGKIAFAVENFVPFSSPRDREHMMELRATADAILCGARTVEASEATLGNGGEKYRRQRLKNGLAEFPLRVIVSGGGTIDPRSKIFQHHFSPIVVLTTRRVTHKKLALLKNVADEVKMFGETEMDFPAALRWLRKKWNVRRLLSEGGGGVNDGIIRAHCLDELHLTICPKIFGGRIAPTLAEGSGFHALADAERFELTSIRRKKAELFTVFSRRKQGGRRNFT
jgi:2,5-diamino-6-(ribosylamino)-4(3H)-pyrimidinone 5'-phosphate reductase